MKVPVFIFLSCVAMLTHARPSSTRPVPNRPVLNRYDGRSYAVGNPARNDYVNPNIGCDVVLTSEQMRVFFIVWTCLILQDVVREQQQERQARAGVFPASRL